jgi:hypothetical protein
MVLKRVNQLTWPSPQLNMKQGMNFKPIITIKLVNVKLNTMS